MGSFFKKVGSVLKVALNPLAVTKIAFTKPGDLLNPFTGTRDIIKTGVTNYNTDVTNKQNAAIVGQLNTQTAAAQAEAEKQASAARMAAVFAAQNPTATAPKPEKTNYVPIIIAGSLLVVIPTVILIVYKTTK